jgi:type VI secretion system secreted protein Hcp
MSAAFGNGSAADLFLHLQAKRAGKIKGEAAADDHVDDIELNGWQWGLSASSGLGSTQATSRRSYTALTVLKRIDSATTALMAALATNDEIKEAKLTMRRAGGEQEDYFIITLNDARITALQHVVDAAGDTTETVAIAFTRVEVEYRRQKASGQRAGSTVFSDELPQQV